MSLSWFAVLEWMLDLDCILYKNYNLHLILSRAVSPSLGNALTPAYVRLISVLHTISLEQ